MLNPSQLAALRRIANQPVYLKDGLLPDAGPSVQCIAELAALQMVRVIGEGEEERWATTSLGNRELARWSPDRPDRRWPL